MNAGSHSGGLPSAHGEAGQPGGDQWYRILRSLAVTLFFALGLCNSIMFPTTFSLAIEGLGKNSSRASGLLCMAIVGGAIIPPIAGLIADRFGLTVALAAPIACYLSVAAYGRFTVRSRIAELNPRLMRRAGSIVGLIMLVLTSAPVIAHDAAGTALSGGVELSPRTIAP